MPYIESGKRAYYDQYLEKLHNIGSKGELEYCIFKLLKYYVATRDINYSNLHDATYACIHAGEEFRRRFLDKREDAAIEKNGDING